MATDGWLRGVEVTEFNQRMRLGEGEAMATDGWLRGVEVTEFKIRL